MKNKKILYISIILIIILVISVVIFTISSENKNDVLGKNISEKTNKKKKIYEHTFPKAISGNEFFKGKFISNDTASIYPRRDALIRDILVDIGDEVKKGDTLAILFNPGVTGEGNSKINIKNTILSSKNNLLIEVENVKNAKIEELDQKIIEKKTILKETINSFNSKISQIGSSDISGSEYQVELRSLENLKQNLKNALLLKDEILKDRSSDILQKEELLESKIHEIYYKIIPIIYLGNEEKLNYVTINSYDLSDYFGAKNSTLKNEFILKIKKYNNIYKNLTIEEKYKSIIEINNLLIEVLKYSIVTVDINEGIIKGYITNINLYNTSLILQKEMLDDTINTYKILKAQQIEKIENFETNILKIENKLSLLLTKSSSTEIEKKLIIEKLKAEIETLKKSKNLLIANEDKTITALKNEINIAKASLSNEYIKSGDYKIISPFSGIISKRGIEIGEKISPNIEAFRITGVNTTLSKITKKEVRFFVPELLKDNLEIGKEVIFSIGDNNISYTGSIYRISPEIDEKTFSITVQAKVDENIILPNKSTIRVKLITKENTFKIPSSSIYNKEERKIIYYKKDNGKLGIRDINIISEDGEFSLVNGKINENLKIVTTPIFIK